ncbi:shikimate dehydrogenase [Amphibiibacter pelophylacis]|uniref:Shikimate dehydrogenase n=1 Tax=Amphibiibacter pelophylacis TaxID=1799477 RepID=A0ACC6P2I9_9BURK
MTPSPRNEVPQFAVLGHPVAHSRSPWIHAEFARLTGIPLDYGRRDGHEAGPAAWRHLLIQARRDGLRGCNVTVPYKFDALASSHSETPRARRAGAANTLTFTDDGKIEADNTDGVGLVWDITVNAGVALVGQRVLLIGAGGAASGVLGPLLEQQPAGLVVVNRTLERARALVASHADLAGSTRLSACAPADVGEAYDVVINSSSSSLAGVVGAPVPARVLRPGGLALDMMYGPAARSFLDWACAGGAMARDGLGMLVGQAAESFAVWHGVRPPAAQVLATLRELVDRPS